MANDLKDVLARVPQREIAGARSSALFSYQKNWALSELIKMHLENSEYVFAFEFHDDVLILDSETHPSKLCFVQVKTKNTGSNWTVKQLTKPASSKTLGGLSIIGKLYENRSKFGQFNSDLRFVTNAHYSFISKMGPTCANTLKSEDQKYIAGAVNDQLKSDVADDLGCLFLDRCALSVDDHENHIRGILQSFFDALFGDDHCIAVSTWYKSISDQIKKKNDYPPNLVASFDDLLRYKCITRSEISQFIDRVKHSMHTLDSLDVILSQLGVEGYDYRAQIRLKKAWRKYATDRLNYDNRVLKSLESKIGNELRENSMDLLSDTVRVIKEVLKREISKVNYLYDEDYVTCIIVWIHCEQL